MLEVTAKCVLIIDFLINAFYKYLFRSCSLLFGIIITFVFLEHENTREKAYLRNALSASTSKHCFMFESEYTKDFEFLSTGCFQFFPIKLSVQNKKLKFFTTTQKIVCNYNDFVESFI